MAENSAIEWTDATWTPIRARNKATGKVGWHCEHASPGCKFCYSESFNEVRLGTGLPFKPGHREDVEHFLDEVMLLAPLRWRKPRRIFVCSMTDLFGDWVPDAWIDRVFAVMALAPQHTFQVLTKRSARMRAYLTHPMVRARIAMAMAKITAKGSIAEMERGRQIVKRMETEEGWPLPNVWLGISAEDQQRADERVPDLLATPAAVRFVSAEPLLGPIDFNRISLGKKTGFVLGETREQDRPETFLVYRDALMDSDGAFERLDWIIVGGESGPGARPMHPDWARSIRDQCLAAGVPMHFKQHGAWLHETQGAFYPPASWFDVEGKPAGPGWHFWTDGDRGADASVRVGKKAAGRFLDGVEHNGMPEVRHG